MRTPCRNKLCDTITDPADRQAVGGSDDERDKREKILVFRNHALCSLNPRVPDREISVQCAEKASGPRVSSRSISSDLSAYCMITLSYWTKNHLLTSGPSPERRTERPRRAGLLPPVQDDGRPIVTIRDRGEPMEWPVELVGVLVCLDDPDREAVLKRPL